MIELWTNLSDSFRGGFAICMITLEAAIFIILIYTMLVPLHIRGYSRLNEYTRFVSWMLIISTIYITVYVLLIAVGHSKDKKSVMNIISEYPLYTCIFIISLYAIPLIIATLIYIFTKMDDETTLQKNKNFKNARNCDVQIKSDINGQLTSLNVKPGAHVSKGTRLAVISDKRNFFEVISPENGIVNAVNCKQGEAIKIDDLLFGLDVVCFEKSQQRQNHTEKK